MTFFAHIVFQGGLPQACVFKNGEAPPTYLPLYISGTGASLHDIWQKEEHTKRILNSVASSEQLIIPRYKDVLDYFQDLRPRARVYDVPGSFSADASKDAMISAMNNISQRDCGEWQHVAAMAATVYSGLQRRGVLIYGHEHIFPVWSMDTYTGRSKNLVYNTQGVTAEADLRLVNSMPTDMYVQYDWAAADINVAAALSGDQVLADLCRSGDPYEALRSHCRGLSRSECKDALLAAINSMSPDEEILSGFTKLRQWILNARDRLNDGGHVETLLGRKFSIDSERNILAAFNAQMQGTIAHAMHSALSSIWEKYGQYLLTEIHDSIVMVVPARYLKTVSDYVSEVMRKPFAGILDGSPEFPVRISVGKKWRVWQKWKVVGDNGRTIEMVNR